MKRSVLVALAACGLMVVPSVALAGIGARIGIGTSFPNDDAGDDATNLPFAVGAGYKLDLSILELEIDALWWRDSTEFETVAGKTEQTIDYIATPVIARFSLPLVPGLFSLGLGAGLDPHFHVASDPDLSDDIETAILYLPISVNAVLDLKLLAIDLDIRYEHQLTAAYSGALDDARVHHLMFFAGAFF